MALAAALGADRCEIYTDVPGVLTTDPRKVPDAQLMDSRQLQRDAGTGQPRRRRAASPGRGDRPQLRGAPGGALQLERGASGTLLTSRQRPPVRSAMAVWSWENRWTGPSWSCNQAVVALAHVPDRPGVAARLFEALGGAAGLNVDLIVQATHEGASNDIAFTLAEDEAGSGPAGVVGRC